MEGGDKRLGGCKERIFSYLKREGENSGKRRLFINNLPQSGKIFLRWFNGNQSLKFPTKGMAFKVSCGGCKKCKKYYGGSGYKSILKEIEAVINYRLGGRMGLKSFCRIYS